MWDILYWSAAAINESVLESVGIVTTVSWCQVSDGQLSTHYSVTSCCGSIEHPHWTRNRVTSDVNMCHQSDTATFYTIVHLCTTDICCYWIWRRKLHFTVNQRACNLQCTLKLNYPVESPPKCVSCHGVVTRPSPHHWTEHNVGVLRHIRVSGVDQDSSDSGICWKWRDLGFIGDSLLLRSEWRLWREYINKCCSGTKL